MDYRDDDDMYWHMTGQQAFNFEDDDETNTGIDVDDGTVNYIETDGDSRPGQSVQRVAEPQPKVADKTLFYDEDVMDANFEGPGGSLPLNQIISEANLKKLLADLGQEDRPLPRNTKLEDELKFLRRKVQEIVQPAPAPDTITKRLLGKMCSYGAYKSLRDKEILLDEAIDSGDGDAILSVMLFLLNTLNKKNVSRILLTRPVVVEHYTNYLLLRKKSTIYIELMLMLGQFQEAAMYQFRTVMYATSTVDNRKQSLSKIFNEYFSTPTTIPFYHTLASDYINVLEWQITEKTKANHPPSRLAITDDTVLECLYYACGRHNWSQTDTTGPVNPYRLAQEFRIAERQFEWVTLNERGKQKAWREIEAIFEHKSWHNLRAKFTARIPLENIILRLQHLEAPVAILNFFLGHMDDQAKKLSLSRRVLATRSIIDALVALKMQVEFEELRLSLPENCEERYYAENAAKNFNSSWKADGIKIIKK